MKRKNRSKQNQINKGAKSSTWSLNLSSVLSFSWGGLCYSSESLKTGFGMENLPQVPKPGKHIIATAAWNSSLTLAWSAICLAGLWCLCSKPLLCTHKGFRKHHGKLINLWFRRVGKAEKHTFNRWIFKDFLEIILEIILKLGEENINSEELVSCVLSCWGCTRLPTHRGSRGSQPQRGKEIQQLPGWPHYLQKNTLQRIPYIDGCKFFNLPITLFFFLIKGFLF